MYMKELSFLSVDQLRAAEYKTLEYYPPYRSPSLILCISVIWCARFLMVITLEAL